MTASRPTLTVSVPNSAAIDSQTIQQPERGPHAPRREAPEEEVVAVAHLVRRLRRRILRRAELEVQVVDQHQRHREHQRAEIPEASPVALEVDPAAEQAEHEERRGEQRLGERMVAVRVADPLPLEVQPPHPDLLGERRLSVAQVGLAVLAAVEVVLERVVRPLRERARELELRAARRRFALVDRREVRGANRLRRERREAEHHARRGTRARSFHRKIVRGRRMSTAMPDRGSGEHARHVVRVAEPAEVRDEHEDPVGLATVRVVGPANHQPRDHGDADERDRVDLLVHDRLIPDGERRRADERRRARRRAPAASAPGTSRPGSRSVMRNHMPADTALQIAARMLMRTATVVAIGRIENTRPMMTKSGLPGGWGSPKRVRRRDVLARVPHRRGRRQGDQVQHECAERDAEGGSVRRAVVELGRRGGGH